MSKTIAFVLLTVALAVVSTAFCEVKIQRDGFTLSLPDGWVEIPRDAIDSYEKKMAELAPSVHAQHYDSGFQLGSPGKWFSYPYVLIQVNTRGRIQESRLEQLKENIIPNVLDQKERFSAIMSDIKVGEMLYDSRNNIIWMRMELDIRGFGPVTGLAGMVPTERGFIQAIGYCRKDDYKKYENAFRSILVSVTPDAELAYKPQFTDSPATGLSWTEIATTAAAGALIGVVVGLILRSRRKKRQHN